VLTLYQNKLKVGIELETSIADLEAVCYPDELNQVWTNLLHNALQAMDNEGKLTIKLLKEGDNAIFSVTDSGKGIPTEIRGKIFQPFFTTKARGEGSGMGLDIVKKIVEQKHGGRIWFDSEIGVGTTFYVSLPM
jgi:signal transduction histidine kinase